MSSDRDAGGPTAEAADVVGYYLLDGVPILLTEHGGPVTAYGQAVEWGEWIERAESISPERYEEMLRGEREPR